MVLIDRDIEAAERRAEELRRAGGECVAIECDVADDGQVQAAFADGEQQLGMPSALVTSAGIDVGGLVHELEPADWDRVIAVNLRGTFLACREAIRRMLPHGGAIVCISSPLALVATGAVAAYGSSKAGVCALVRSLAVDYATHGIRVNALLPGATETELMWANVPRNRVDAMRETVRQEVPLGRLAEPDEIAQAALWLVSASASYVTGAQLACDGGLLARAPISI